MSMFFREDLFVLDGLNSSVVMMLMNLAVHCLGGFFMAMRFDGFIGNARVDQFVHFGSMAFLRGVLKDGLFGGLHGGLTVWLKLDGE